MIICHEHRFIYLKTRKTASTSMEIALRGFCGPRCVITRFSPADEVANHGLGHRGPQNDSWIDSNGKPTRLMNHCQAMRARTVVGESVWKNYFKFTIERCPYEKAISEYYFATRKSGAKITLSDFLESSQTATLSNWDIYTIDEKIAVDFVGRYENLDDELQQIANLAGLKRPLVLPVYRAKGAFRLDPRGHREVMSFRDREIIEKICAKEIEAFDFRW